jgi:hypothetical protein
VKTVHPLQLSGCHVVKLKCEDDGPSYDQRVRYVLLHHETTGSWFGHGVIDIERLPHALNYEYSQWPKYAWKRVP